MTNQTGWKRPFFTIVAGQAVSMVGSAGVQFAMIWWLAERTASPLVMGMAGLVAFLPMTLLSPLAGVWADKYNRKWISILSDLSMGVLAFLYAMLLLAFDLPVWTVLIMLCARGVGATFQQPAIQSIMPQLVPQEELLKSNGWFQLIASGSFILGPVVGALLYAAVPMWVILLTDVIGAAAASIALAVVKIPPLEHPEGHVHQPFLVQFREGIAVYRADRPLFLLVLCEALSMFFFAPLSSFYPLMTSSYFDLSALHGGIVEMGFAAGMMIAAALFTGVLKVRHKIGTAYFGLFGCGLCCLIGGILPPTFAGWLIFAAACACMGAFSNVHSIPMMTYIQETIPAEKMGRAFSLLTLISSLAMPVGLLIGSPVADRVGVHAWFFISGLGMMLLNVGFPLCAKLQRK